MKPQKRNASQKRPGYVKPYPYKIPIPTCMPAEFRPAIVSMLTSVQLDLMPVEDRRRIGLFFQGWANQINAECNYLDAINERAEQRIRPAIAVAN